MSVVIPAHNEERVIGRTLETMLRGAESGELEVVVACNGCTDGTSRIAGSYAGVRVVEVSEASKAAALNAGDRAATAFPRVFLDADIDVEISALRAVREALTGPEVRAAAPAISIDTSGCSWPVAAYFAVWQRLPYLAGGVIGSGFYAMSEAGRALFPRFPDLVADDLFAQRLFDADQQVVVSGSFVMRPPRRTSSLLRSKTRVYAGNAQYSAAVARGEVPAGVATAAGTEGTRQAFLALARNPLWWPRLAAYAGVVAAARVRADIRLRRGHTTRWDQDVTGRAA
jgi:glycosyltransferase involved in cell wall biosynthesis